MNIYLIFEGEGEVANNFKIVFNVFLISLYYSSLIQQMPVLEICRKKKRKPAFAICFSSSVPPLPMSLIKLQLSPQQLQVADRNPVPVLRPAKSSNCSAPGKECAWYFHLRHSEVQRQTPLMMATQ